MEGRCEIVEGFSFLVATWRRCRMSSSRRSRSNTPLLRELKRKHAERERRGTFALGPIDLAWASACDQAYPGALLLALGISAYAKMRGSPTPVGNTLGAKLQLDPRKRRRALAGLEAAGLVLVERRPNRVPRATLVPWPPKTEPQSSADQGYELAV